MPRTTRKTDPPALPPAQEPVPLPEGHALIPAQPTRGELYVARDAHPSMYPTNVPDTAWGRAVKVNAENASWYQPDRDGVVVVPTTYFLVFPSEQVDPATGEVTPCLRVALIDAEGRHLSTSSEIVRRRLYAIIGHNGPGPWAPPLRLCVRIRRTRDGQRQYHELSQILE